MKKTIIVRVDAKFDEMLERYANVLSDSCGRKITKTEASLIFAQNQPNIIIVRKKGWKPLVGI